MSEKTLKGILITLTILVVLWGFKTIAGRAGAGRTSTGGALSQLFENLDTDAIDGAHLVGPTSEIELQRTALGWTVNDFEADSSSVARLLSSLRDMVVGGVVATNPANHGRLGVTSDSAWAVALSFSDGSEVRFLVGKSGSRWQTAFARLPDADEVHLLRGDVRSAITRDLEAWRDKNVVGVDTAAVSTLEVTRDGTTFSVVRSADRADRADSSDGADGWLLDGDSTDVGAVQRILQELAHLQAMGFASNDEIDEGEDLRRLVALGASGDTLAVLDLGSAGTSLWVTSRGKDTVFELPSWRADRLTPTRESLAGEG